MKTQTKKEIIASIGNWLSPEGDAQAIVKLEALGADQEAQEALTKIRARLTNPRMLFKFERALARFREEEFAE